ncbi:hypothetical protein [Thermosyntropha sp.]|uniref:phasin family protein n=1 Tax=Thermosyntropha sp. TaxID=2740820 RepID=UPI0025FACA67|nr:hypothetical protein [Thermosyntropha sp.]MBO8157993.1 hypothetical protein [Thermosyntropha sp.]
MMNTKETMERSFAMLESALDKYWDMWLVSLGSMSWSQEQVENMLKKYLDQRRTAREESTKIIEEMMQQVKKNQMQIQSMVKDAVLSALESVDFPAYTSSMDELKKKVDELSKKIEDK